MHEMKAGRLALWDVKSVVRDSYHQNMSCKSKSCVQAVPENKGREAKVTGMCIAKRRRGYRTSFTLLNHIPGGGPVERSFPL